MITQCFFNSTVLPDTSTLHVVTILKEFEEQEANAHPLEPTESPVRSVEVPDELTMAFRVQGIANVDGLKEACKEVCVDPENGLGHKNAWTLIRNAWGRTRAQIEVKERVDAVAKAHGEPVTMLTKDRDSLIKQFKQLHSTHLTDSGPGTSTLRNVRTKATGRKVGGGGTAIAVEVRAFRHMGLHLGSSLTMETKRKYVSMMPSDIEDLRKKYRVMTN